MAKRLEISGSLILAPLPAVPHMILLCVTLCDCGRKSYSVLVAEHPRRDAERVTCQRSAA